MARVSNRLTWLRIKNAKPGDRLADGNGLYLEVNPTGSRSFIYRYSFAGRERWMGLGPVGDPGRPTTTLEAARDKAHAARKLVKAGIDPIDQQRAERAAVAIEAAKAISFRDCAGRYIANNKAAWSVRHAKEWADPLEAYAYPVIGNLPAGEIEVGHVTAILEPIWAERAVTAGRVRSRIEMVLDYAATLGWRAGENPARWRGHLQNILPKSSKITTVEHHAAVPWTGIGALMRRLEAETGAAVLALRFTILTAARASEALGATWGEVDMQAATWVIPGGRMKAGKQHSVPLSDAALAVLREAARLRERPGDDVLLFPSSRHGRPQSPINLRRVLARAGGGEATVHGTARSTFADWAAEATNHARELVEQSLSHAVGNAVERAFAAPMRSRSGAG